MTDEPLFSSGECDPVNRRRFQYGLIAYTFSFGLLMFIMIYAHVHPIPDHAYLILVLASSAAVIISVISMIRISGPEQHTYIHEDGITQVVHLNPSLDCRDLKPGRFSTLFKWDMFSHYVDTGRYLTLVPKKRGDGVFSIGPEVYDRQKRKVTIKDVKDHLNRKLVARLDMKTIEHNRRVRSLLESRNIEFRFIEEYKVRVENVEKKGRRKK